MERKDQTEEEENMKKSRYERIQKQKILQNEYARQEIIECFLILGKEDCFRKYTYKIGGKRLKKQEDRTQQGLRENTETKYVKQEFETALK